jgi:S1-C subfamily serine protease
MNTLEITEGDFAYVLGFPMGITGGRRNTVIVRSGSIARIRDVLVKANHTFLIDAFIFPGNSGGPVILKPETLSIQGTKAQNTAYLIGIVHSYLTYQDVAISSQTKKPKVIFEENSGLAAVHPVDFIDETINEYNKSLKTKE